MSSPSDSTSPGSGASRADASQPAPARRRRSLRFAVLVAFVPLCLVVTFGMLQVMLDARHVHRDLQRMFEELREVSLVRSLQDELRGFESWVQAVPAARLSTHPLVIADLRHHLEAARTTFARFHTIDDPSQAAHQHEELGTLQRIGNSLDRLEVQLAEERPIADLGETLGIALHSAAVLGHTVDQESRGIGDSLDQRSARMTQFLGALGIASLATVAWLGWLLLRRVLAPVRALREGAEAMGRGQLDVVIRVPPGDELGQLAASFTTMAGQLRQNREELEQRVEQRSREVLRTARLAELGTLAAGIAHEINNPLASIAACAEGLLREFDGGEPVDQANLRDYLQIIRKEAQRSCDITARLLRFARQGEERREVVWLGTELREVAPMFAHQFATARVELQLRSEGDQGPAIVGDAAAWRQVLFNLLRNALDASPPGSRVQVHCHTEQGEVKLEVADEGPGVPIADQDRIFEPFFTTKAPGKGTGLGLSIVHRIVVGHGGRIEVENGPRGGAVFRILMPAAQPS